MDFSEYNVWSFILLLSLLLGSLLLANMLKRKIPFIRKSLIPTSVLGGLILLIVSIVYQAATKTLGQEKTIFDLQIFGGNGSKVLEMITYHCLALGFIASSLKTSKEKITGKRVKEVFNTGVQTVSTYLIQAIFGIIVTIACALWIFPDLLPASGILLCLGFGQGTGQALNFGNIYEAQGGLTNGANFGLSIACIGFLVASIGGVIYLNVIKKRRGLVFDDVKEKPIPSEEIQGDNEIPVNGSIDKITFQIIFIVVVYAIAFAIIKGLSLLLPGFSATLYGFNFLFGVLIATLFKTILNACNKKKVVKRVYINNFFMDRISNFFFDLMIVSGVAAIRLDLLGDYWHILLVLGVGGFIITYFYTLFISKKLFPEYADEQFLMMFGMLTGTASTGMVLLRELDPQHKTPAAENLVFQNLPAMVFGFPIMLLVPRAMEDPYGVLLLIVIFFVVLVLILFRNKIFKKKNKEVVTTEVENVEGKNE